MIIRNMLYFIEYTSKFTFVWGQDRAAGPARGDFTNSAGYSGSGAADKARDAMSYVVTVEDGGASTELRRSDATMTPEFDALVACLEKYAA